MYTEKTLRGLARSLCALVLVLVVTCIAMFVAASNASASGATVTASADGVSDSNYSSIETVTETTQPESTTEPQAHAWVMQVAGVPYYYNWEIQDDGLRNDRNFGKDLWSEALTKEDAYGLFFSHMSRDPRACAATVLGLSKELGFSAMPDEQDIVNESERVNAAATHYEADHDYWQADYATMANAVYNLDYDIEEIGEYSSACYMIFNGYERPPIVIVSPSIRTGGHALVFYKQDGSKIRFRLECSFQLVDVLIATETEPEPDIPETTTTPATTTTVETTTAPATTTTVETTTTTVVTTTVETTQPTTQPTTESTTKSTTVATTTTETVSTTQPTTTSTSESTTVSTSESTTTETTTTTAPESTTTTQPTTDSTTTSTTKATTTTTTTQVTTTTTSTTKATTTTTTTQPTTESTTPESTTSTTESTTTSTTTTSQTTTETTTTQPETTTTLESKNPEQAPDVTDDADLGGDADSTDVNTDASPEPDLPGMPTTSANPSVSTNGAEQAPTQATTSLPETNATLPPRDGLAVVQQVLEAIG